jgi:hypothetical protein
VALAAIYGKHLIGIHNLLHVPPPPSSANLFVMEVCRQTSRVRPLKVEKVGMQAEELSATGNLYRKLVRITAQLFVAAITVLVLSVPALPQSAPANDRISAGDLLRKVVNEELNDQRNDHSHWMYEVKSEESGKEKVKLVVESSDGDLDRLRSVDGRPITAQQEDQEDQRIKEFLNRRDAQNKRRKAEREDDRQTEHLFKMLPDAVNATYGKTEGDVAELLFQPNPTFEPSTREDAVFHAMEGRIWVNTREYRLVGIEGHLIKEVKFGAGLLGYLDRGGEFHVRQSEVAPGHWEVTLMRVNMHGKALFFKTIAVQQNETRYNFQPVPDKLTLTEAADELQNHSRPQSAGADRGAVASASGTKTASARQ